MYIPHWRWAMYIHLWRWRQMKQSILILGRIQIIQSHYWVVFPQVDNVRSSWTTRTKSLESLIKNYNVLGRVPPNHWQTKGLLLGRTTQNHMISWYWDVLPQVTQSHYWVVFPQSDQRILPQLIKKSWSRLYTDLGCIPPSRSSST